jgi:hypothetical protein
MIMKELPKASLKEIDSNNEKKSPQRKPKNSTRKINNM